ncbi:MAG: hypothetical protein F6K35_47865, partial [Okeania sp. SIO2H7]|nr:hypothetical protein [Okeania sp. SIO2H7]
WKSDRPHRKGGFTEKAIAPIGRGGLLKKRSPGRLKKFKKFRLLAL